MKFKLVIKIIYLTTSALITLLLAGCSLLNGEADRKAKQELVIKSIETPTSPIVTAFEKICLNNESSPADMIKAAKAYNIGEITTSPYKHKKLIAPFKYEYSTGTYTTMTTADKTMRFNIYEPNVECEVMQLSNRNVIVDALLVGKQYNDTQKIMDLQLGMILFRKYGESIQVSKMLKLSNSSMSSYGPLYSRSNGEKQIYYSVRPISDTVAIKLSEKND